jgi:release factor glutamine methyltransferase
MLQQQLGQQQEQQQGTGHPPVATASVWAVDLSAVGVAYTAANVARCGVEAAVRPCLGSWFGPLSQLRGQLGGVLSNPPYIPHEEMAGLQVEVGRHEPWGALDGGQTTGTDSLQV